MCYGHHHVEKNLGFISLMHLKVCVALCVITHFFVVIICIILNSSVFVYFQPPHRNRVLVWRRSQRHPRKGSITWNSLRVSHSMSQRLANELLYCMTLFWELCCKTVVLFLTPRRLIVHNNIYTIGPMTFFFSQFVTDNTFKFRLPNIFMIFMAMGILVFQRNTKNCFWVVKS